MTLVGIYLNNTMPDAVLLAVNIKLPPVEDTVLPTEFNTSGQVMSVAF